MCVESDQCICIEKDVQKAYLKAQTLEMMNHRWILSEKLGYDAGEQSYMDWVKNYAGIYRNYWFKELFVKCVQVEIDKYKWLKSEQEKHDIGFCATIEWMELFYNNFKENFVRKYKINLQ